MNFSFYRINADYCEFLRNADPCVPYTMQDKSLRPFVGIVFSLNAYHYYAPLTSPKASSHEKACLQKVTIKIFPSDAQPEAAYKNLLANQLSWCNSHKNTIVTHAGKLYHIIKQGN